MKGLISLLLVSLQDGRIIADGPPGDVLTAQGLSNLYGIAVEPVRLADGRLVIAPAVDRTSPRLPHAPD